MASSHYTALPMHSVRMVLKISFRHPGARDGIPFFPSEERKFSSPWQLGYSTCSASASNSSENWLETPLMWNMDTSTVQPQTQLQQESISTLWLPSLCPSMLLVTDRINCHSIKAFEKYITNFWRGIPSTVSQSNMSQKPMCPLKSLPKK